MITEFVKRRAFEFEDWVFERRHGFNVGGVVPHADLVVSDSASLVHSNAYQAVWNRNLRVIFSEAKKAGYELSCFVDIGSGKGKACLYSHTKRAFARNIGVEFSLPLVEIAIGNKKKIGAADVEFLNADAMSYLLPDENCLVFMFNPFDEVMLSRFIENNSSHFVRNRSLIAYANDIHRAVLGRHGFSTVFRSQDRKISLHEYPSA